MSDFDPYLKWLGIRESVRPINHYRLLGLDLFESDPEVISMAADRQMAHIRTYQTGPQGELSQQLLNELARARRCLLVPEQKEAYDQELRLGQVRASAEVSSASNKALPIANPVPTAGGEAASETPVPIQISSDPDARRRARGREKKQMIWGMLGWLGGGLAAVGLSFFLINTGVIPWGDSGRGDENQNAVAMLNDDNDPEPDPTSVAADKNSSDRNNDPPALNSVDQGTGVANGGQANPDAPSSFVPPEGSIDPSIAAPRDTAKEDPQFSNPMFPLEPLTDPVMYNGPMLPPATEFTLGNSSEYPDVPEAIGLMKSQFAEIEAGTAVQSRPSNQLPRQTTFEAMPSEPSLVVGARVWVNRESNVSALQPIYLTEKGISPGPRHGKLTRYSVDLIAKPGYAVASVSLSPTFPMQSIALNFAKITNRGLDLNDQYTSDRVGARRGAVLTIAPESPGVPVLALFIGTMRIEDRDQVASLRLLTTGKAFDRVAYSELLPNRTPTAVEVPMTTDPFAPTPGDAGNTSDSSPLVDTRTEIPSVLDRENAKAAIEQRYKRDFERAARINNTRSRNRDLQRIVDNMVAEAETSSTTERYVLHEQAILVSASIGDINLAMRSLIELSDEFKIDYWATVQDTLKKTAANVGPSGQQEFKDKIDQLIAEAVEKGEFEKGEELIAGAAQIATSMRVTTLKTWYKTLGDELDELKKLKTGFEKAQETLATTPDDAKANLAMGDYAFLHQDLEKALEYWEKSKATSVAKLVQLEKETDRSDAKQMLDLCSAWQRLGKGRHSLKRSKALRQAYVYYGQTIRLLEGSKREKAQTNYDELEQQLSTQTPVARLFE